MNEQEAEIQKFVKIYTKSVKTVDSLITDLNNLKVKVSKNKPSFFSILFRRKSYTKFVVKLRGIEKSYFEINLDAVIIINNLRSDFDKSATMGNIMLNLNNSLPNMVILSFKISYISILISNLNTELSEIKSINYALLSMVLGALSVLLGYIALQN